MKRIWLLWGAAFFLIKTTYIHHNSNISATGSTHLKSGPTLKEKLTGGVNSLPFWQEGLSCKLWKCAQYTHKTYKTKQHWKTGNMHLNINIFTTGNTHLKYRKHRVHSAAHKLKIRSSRLVLTTAGTDLDSTDRAATGGAKHSSASEPLKRPILSLWNSRVRSTALSWYRIFWGLHSCRQTHSEMHAASVWC